MKRKKMKMIHRTILAAVIVYADNNIVCAYFMEIGNQCKPVI
jgi:hypothetical protein